MSIRLQMLQVAQLAPQVLGESTPLVQAFIQSKLNSDGGFSDRAGNSDLYYCVFGIESLRALGCELPVSKIIPYLESFTDGANLDLVHLSCLIRCWANLPPGSFKDEKRKQLSESLWKFQAEDMSFHTQEYAKQGSAYGCFIALDALQGLGLRIPRPESIIQCIHDTSLEDGSYALEAGGLQGTTPTTAASIVGLHHLESKAKEESAHWLLQQWHPQGGFRAVPAAPFPDLLSTATALHSLAQYGMDIKGLVDPCLDFIDTLWTNKGAFHGTWEDEHLDCEYTYYGLLSLGHLASYQ